jgi:hypothetical protein
MSMEDYNLGYADAKQQQAQEFEKMIEKLGRKIDNEFRGMGLPLSLREKVVGWFSELLNKEVQGGGGERK